MATENRASSSTALGCAYSRLFSGIFPCWHIFNSLLQNADPTELKEAFSRLNLYAEFAPYFEARYRMTERSIQRADIEQSVELASGLSPHFYERTLGAGSIHVEIDLPENMQLKRQVVMDLILTGVVKPMLNHFMIEGSVIDEDVFRAAIHHLKRRPTAFIIAGLLRYVSPEDRAVLFHERICPVLKQFRGKILTSDIELLSEANKDPESVARYDKMAETFGFDVRPNLFLDIDHARQFFSGLGGTLEELTLHTVSHTLISPKPLGIQYEAVQKLIDKHHRFFEISF